MIKRVNRRLEPMVFSTAIVVTGILIGALLWLHCNSYSVEPLGQPYHQFLVAVAPGFLVLSLGVAVVFLKVWKRNKLLCGTIGILLFQRLLELHIVFVIINSRMTL